MIVAFPQTLMTPPTSSSFSRPTSDDAPYPPPCTLRPPTTVNETFNYMLYVAAAVGASQEAEFGKDEGKGDAEGKARGERRNHDNARKLFLLHSLHP